ncbi:PKD domain-containing protein [Candidatus Woesearchaeota archaeon]|nr:PKD domain-containing protein [Candidatus Woesearchaeota archaeon]
MKTAPKFSFLFSFFFVLVILIFLVVSTPALAAVKVYNIQETDFVRVLPETVDLDGDYLNYTFSAPLDERGEWQTGYDDAGEYEVEITASDGTAVDKRKIKIIVKDKNQPPFLKERKLIVKETQTADLKSLVEDPEGDLPSFSFPPPFNKQGLWNTEYGDEGRYVIPFVVSDGKLSVQLRAEVEVQHTNQPPIIKSSFSTEKLIKINEDSTLEFNVDAYDREREKLTYSWRLNEEKLDKEKIDIEEISNDYYGENKFDFESAGEYVLSLKISDGERETEEEWKIEVKNVNRAPDLTKQDDLKLEVYESELVKLELPEKDADGEKINYEFAAPLDKKGSWQTDYEDAGEYELNVKASDGELEDSARIKIKVLDVDRAPTLNVPKEMVLQEGEEFRGVIESTDPDEDELVIKINGLPEGANFEEEGYNLTWKPEFNLVEKRAGWKGEMLSALRLGRFLLKDKEFVATINSCGRELCTTAETKLIVKNTNRAPEFESLSLSNLTFTEKEKVKLNIKALDPDGDLVRYYFSPPLSKIKGEWETNYYDAGIHTFFVTASDGTLTTTIPVNITIKNYNRLPQLKINDDTLTVNEEQQFLVRVEAGDEDEDNNLSLFLENPPKGASFVDGVFVWEPGISTVQNKSAKFWDNIVEEWPYLNKKFSSDKETIWLNFAATDGFDTVKHPVKVVVKNVNQAPQIIDYSPVEEIMVEMNKPVYFQVNVNDADQDYLDYRWDFGLGEATVKGTNTVERTFTSTGRKTVNVVASDGRETVEKEFRVKVVRSLVEAGNSELVGNNIIETGTTTAAVAGPLTFRVMVIKG